MSRLILLACLSVTAGCAATMRPYVHDYAPRPAATNTGLKVGVVPAVDEREPSGWLVANRPAAWATLWLPVYPMGWNEYDRPEAWASGVGRGIAGYVADAAALELRSSGMFAEVEVADTVAPAQFDAALRVSVYRTHQKQTYISWGLSVGGFLLWLFGVPEGVTTVNIDLGLTLVRASDGETLLADRQHVELTDWFGAWWGPAPSRTQNDAVHAAMSRFLDRVQAKASDLAVKGKAGPAVVNREPPSFAGKKIAVAPLQPGSGVPAATTRTIGDVLLAEVSKRFASGSVIGVVDIENMLGLEKLKDLAGCAETACAAEVGGALGVDYLISGNLGEVGKYLILSVTLIDVRASRPLTRATRKVSVDDLGRVIDELPATIDDLLR